MKNILRPLGAAVTGIVAAVLVSSCYYDPYYSSTSVTGSYSSGGYGHGYGYGGSNFSTSFFVSTGNPGWGYDPYAQAYYDYRRRAYYDPYLYGYYPVGYRPPLLVGCPHPYGYRPGSYCPPPRVIRYNSVPNYHNRESAYRASNYDWARQVRQKPVVNRPVDTHSSTNRGQQSSGHTRNSESRNGYRDPHSNGNQSYVRDSRGNSRYEQKTPSRSNQTATNQRNAQTRNAPSPPDARGGKRPPQPQASTPSRNQQQEQARKEEARKEESRNVRGLGQTRR